MTTESQNKQINAHLESGKGISPLLALRLFKCWRLGARIYDLRQSGKEIFTQKVNHGGKSFALYYMRNSPHFEIYNKDKNVSKDNKKAA